MRQHKRILGFRQRSLHSLPRRVENWLAGRVRARPPRNHGAFLVDVGGYQIKRAVLSDSYHASRVARALEEFSADDVFPGLLLEREREVWLEWIEGERVVQPDEEVVSQLARLLSVLHARRPRKVPADATPFPSALRRDLAFLQKVGVLTSAACSALTARSAAMTPRELWIGYDCTDAILKNFVRGSDGKIRAVDVESLGADQLIGVGPAKACLRWVGRYRNHFLSELLACGSPDFQHYFDFVELSFLAFWQKTSFLEGKLRFVDPRLFDRYGMPH